MRTIVVSYELDNIPTWFKRVKWLWHQDDAIPREDTEEDAWEALFGSKLPRKYICRPGVDVVMAKTHDEAYMSNPYWLICADCGDADYLLGEDGRVYLSSYPGNCAIGVLIGPGIAV